MAPPAQRCLCGALASSADLPNAHPRGSPAAGACRAAGRGAQGDVLFGGAVVNLGGGGMSPCPIPMAEATASASSSHAATAHASLSRCAWCTVPGFAVPPAHARGTTRVGLGTHAGATACTQPCTLEMSLLPGHPERSCLRRRTKLTPVRGCLPTAGTPLQSRTGMAACSLPAVWI